MHRFWRISMPGLVALAILLLALPVGRLSLAAWSRITEETHEETRGHTDPIKIGSVAASSVDPRRRHRLLPRRHLLLSGPRAHVRIQLEAPARHDSYKRPLRC